jgi:hypothetical protein
VFPTRYFGDRYYAPRYFPKVGEDQVAPVGQSPRATRYRMGYAVQTVIRLLLAMVKF